MLSNTQNTCKYIYFENVCNRSTLAASKELRCRGEVSNFMVTKWSKSSTESTGAVNFMAVRNYFYSQSQNASHLHFMHWFVIHVLKSQSTLKSSAKYAELNWFHTHATICLGCRLLLGVSKMFTCMYSIGSNNPSRPFHSAPRLFRCLYPSISLMNGLLTVGFL